MHQNVPAISRYVPHVHRTFIIVMSLPKWVGLQPDHITLKLLSNLKKI